MSRNHFLDPVHRDERRRRVEHLKIRGRTVREIVEDLAQSGFVNPATGKPYSIEPIQRDIAWLRKEWAKRHEEEIAVHVARQLAAIREALRMAWSRGDLTEIRHYLKREAKLLGLDAPKEQRFAGPKGGPLQVEAAPRKTEAQELREIDEHLAELDRERRQIAAERLELERELAELEGEDEHAT
jgi:hypothetical protein